jgi:hypothetical protein
VEQGKETKKVVEIEAVAQKQQNWIIQFGKLEP